MPNRWNACRPRGHDYDCPRWTQVYAAADGELTDWVDGSPDSPAAASTTGTVDAQQIHTDWALADGTVFGSRCCGHWYANWPLRVLGNAGGVPHLHLEGEQVTAST